MRGQSLAFCDYQLRKAFWNEKTTKQSVYQHKSLVRIITTQMKQIKQFWLFELSKEYQKVEWAKVYGDIDKVGHSKF